MEPYSQKANIHFKHNAQRFQKYTCDLDSGAVPKFVYSKCNQRN